ncbi:beta-galactosidase [Thiospirochaeta perfilievii]|uniref:Beta-galactosidase n=2 Tax=Thiospirochaeta perfilievii TaxID=252967 RepID=A0A5C1QH01_9SPIO|nr:beta-galactosidase [Thiospirochaeta perfilievii]
MKLFKEAGVNIVTLPVFSWAKFQSDETSYHFQWFDKIIDRITDAGLSICFATSTAVQPAWMSRKYPNILPVDFQGNRRKFGGRVKFCPNSKEYNKFSTKLVEQLVERYGDNKNIKFWHIGNEYDNWCYCEKCENDFKLFLKKRYKTVDNLNRAWYTSFWGHTLYSWDDIVAPSGLTEMWNDNGRIRTTFQSISLDYARFMSESIFNCYKAEYDIIKKAYPNIPITTNFMGFFKPINYFKWAPYIDIISWDSYPGVNDPAYLTSMRHDLMRSLKKDRPFLLMEQTPSQTNWSQFNSQKRPGDMALQSFQAVAHGSDSVMFFQLRRSIGACEKFHSGLIDHVGHGNTRVFKECAELGKLLNNIGDSITGTIQKNDVAILFDWENWWALEYSSGPSTQLEYLKEMEKYYYALFKSSIGVDFITPDSKLGEYKTIIAPTLYLLSNENALNIITYVKEGGTLLTTFQSGIVDESDTVHPGGYPGPLRKLLGIWVEETDSLPMGVYNSAIPVDPSFKKEVKCDLIFDVIHLEGAKVLAKYGSDYYQNTPVITENRFGSGRALYVGSSLEQDGIDNVVELSIGLKKHVFNIPSNVEYSKREDENKELHFFLNHTGEHRHITWDQVNYIDLTSQKNVNGFIELEPKGIKILLRNKNEF